MAGVNYRCLDFDLHYIYSKTNNNYYAKIQKNSTLVFSIVLTICFSDC